MRVLGDWLLTPARVAIHLPTRTAVAADLHLGYDRVRRRGGEAIPFRRIAEELGPLARVLAAEAVSRVVIAGDLFEDARHQRDEMVEELRAWLADHAVDLVAVVPGNHDRGLGKSDLPVTADGTDVGDWHIVHGDGLLPPGNVVQGHEHPVLRLGGGAQGPCYLVADGHLVLPAYSTDAAGGNVLGLDRWSRHRCAAIAGDRVLDFGVLGDLRRRLT